MRRFGVEVMEQADFPLQPLSRTVLCSPSRVFHLQWPCEPMPLLVGRFMSGSSLWPGLPQPICEKKIVPLGALVQHQAAPWPQSLPLGPTSLVPPNADTLFGGNTPKPSHPPLYLAMVTLLLAGFVFPLLWNLTQSEEPASPLACLPFPSTQTPYHHCAGHHSQAVCSSPFRCDRIGFITR